MALYDHALDPVRTKRDGLTCEIGWIDQHANATYDLNPAVGRVRLPERHRMFAGRSVTFPASRWFLICDCHARQLAAAGMADWQFEPFYAASDESYYRRHGEWTDWEGNSR